MNLNTTATFFHVRITPKSRSSSGRRSELQLDMSLEEAERRFLEPYRAGTPLAVNGRTITMDDLERITFYESDQRVGHLAEIPWRIVRDVTDKFITGPPGSVQELHPQVDGEPRPPADSREVFVVHGRNLLARDALFEFLRAIDLHPLEWSEAISATGKPSPYIGEILDAAFSTAHAVVVLFTPDDEAHLRQEFRRDNDPLHETELTGQARPNVLFEAGMGMGRYPERTVLVELGSLRPFSDIAGLHVIRMDDSSQRRQELAQRLRTTGSPVKLDGTDWHTAGDFDAAIKYAPLGTSESNVPLEQEPSPSISPSLTEEALLVLSEASKDQRGFIHVVPTPQGKVFETNRNQFGRSGDRRVDAKYERALADLIELELISDNSGEGTFFGVTRKGFELLDTHSEASS